MSIVPESIEFNIPLPGFLFHGRHLDPSLLMGWVAWGLIALFSVFAARGGRLVPHGVQNLFELTSGLVLDLADSAIGHDASDYYPLFLGVFFYVLLGNLIGLVPGLSSPTASLNTTAAIAIVVFVYYNVQGLRRNGWGYIKHFMGPPLPWYLFPISMLIFVIEIIGHCARPMSLAIRLFGNIFAKEVLLGILALLVVIFLRIPNPFLRFSLASGPLILRPLIILLGLLVSAIQAFVFLILSVIYVAGAVQTEHH